MTHTILGLCQFCIWRSHMSSTHNNDVIMSAMASQITPVSIVCSTVCSGTDKRKHQSSASLAFVRRIHRWPVNSPHKEQVTRKMFPLNDVITRHNAVNRNSPYLHCSWNSWCNHYKAWCQHICCMFYATFHDYQYIRTTLWYAVTIVVRSPCHKSNNMHSV